MLIYADKKVDLSEKRKIRESLHKVVQTIADVNKKPTIAMPFLLLSLVVSAVCMTHYLVTPIDPKMLALLLAAISSLLGFMGLAMASKKAVSD